MREMDLSEQFAEAVLALALPHARVSHLSDQSHGEHDFALHFPDGRSACVEVASIVDDQHLETIAAIVSPKKGGTTIAAQKSRGSWYVSLSEAADVRRVRRDLDNALATMEAGGITSFDLRIDNQSTPALQSLSRLGLTSGDIVPFVPKGQIWLGLPSNGGWLSPHYVNIAVADAAARPDNVRKLTNSACSETHLFVYLDSSAFDPYSALVFGRGLAGPPDLPEHISHVWVGAFRSSLLDARVWRATRGGGWILQDLCFPETKVFTRNGRPLGGDA